MYMRSRHLSRQIKITDRNQYFTYKWIWNYLKTEDEIEIFSNGVASCRAKGRENLKIYFTTATLFKVSSNYVVSSSITVLCFFPAVNHLLFSFFAFFLFFSALKLKEIKIIWSFEIDILVRFFSFSLATHLLPSKSQ